MKLNQLIIYQLVSFFLNLNKASKLFFIEFDTFYDIYVFLPLLLVESFLYFYRSAKLITGSRCEMEAFVDKDSMKLAFISYFEASSPNPNYLKCILISEVNSFILYS